MQGILKKRSTERDEAEVMKRGERGLVVVVGGDVQREDGSRQVCVTARLSEMQRVRRREERGRK